MFKSHQFWLATFTVGCLVFACGARLGSAQNNMLRDDSNGEPVANYALSEFAENVVLHVVLHELGHALIREFDLPILGNEETMADAFATHYLTTYMPDRAPVVIEARVQSLMLEANEVPRGEWTVKGEHNSDARRAYQIAAMAVSKDPARYGSVARVVGMNDADKKRCRDYGSEIHRSWRRILRPLMMPSDVKSTEARMKFESNCNISKQVRESRLNSEIEKIIQGFDWHSQVTVSFVQGDGGAGWSRSKRTITVNSEYVKRFIQQGKSVN